MNKKYMTDKELLAWQKRMNFSDAEACTALGLARHTFRRYRDGGKPVRKVVALAACAVEVKMTGGKLMLPSFDQAIL